MAVYADISTPEAVADRRRRAASKIVVWSTTGLVLFCGAFIAGHHMYTQDAFIKEQMATIDEQAGTIADLATRNQACTGAALNAQALNEAWHAWARDESVANTDRVDEYQGRINALTDECVATVVES